MATDEDLLQQELDSDPGLARAWFIFLIGNWNKVWKRPLKFGSSALTITKLHLRERDIKTRVIIYKAKKL